MGSKESELVTESVGGHQNTADERLNHRNFLRNFSLSMKLKVRDSDWHSLNYGAAEMGRWK